MLTLQHEQVVNKNVIVWHIVVKKFSENSGNFQKLNGRPNKVNFYKNPVDGTQNNRTKELVMTFSRNVPKIQCRLLKKCFGPQFFGMNMYILQNLQSYCFTGIHQFRVSRIQKNSYRIMRLLPQNSISTQHQWNNLETGPAIQF